MYYCKHHNLHKEDFEILITLTEDNCWNKNNAICMLLFYSFISISYVFLLYVSVREIHLYLSSNFFNEFKDYMDVYFRNMYRKNRDFRLLLWIYKCSSIKKLIK